MSTDGDASHPAPSGPEDDADAIRQDTTGPAVSRERRALAGKVSLIGALLLLAVLQVTLAVRSSMPVRVPGTSASSEPVVSGTTERAPPSGPVAAIEGMPDETQSRRDKGFRLYQDRHCGTCHGEVGEGTDKGPALREKYLKKTPAEVSASLNSGKDESHRRLGTPEEALDITTFVNYIK